MIVPLFSSFEKRQKNRKIERTGAKNQKKKKTEKKTHVPTQSVFFSLLMSETESDGISTFILRMLPQGGVRTSEMTWRA